jgi:hypothetical protein
VYRIIRSLQTIRAVEVGGEVGKVICIGTFKSDCLNWMESGVRDLHVILFILVRFQANRWKEKRTLCTVMYEVLLMCVPSEILSFLDASAKLRKATVIFVMSVRPHGTTRLLLNGVS